MSPFYSPDDSRESAVTDVSTEGGDSRESTVAGPDGSKAIARRR